ncbi:hypothetical protein [Paraburkholderia saeva]|uniref:hypothetical protein n=1 Tax=Paraburkholderia saeva TaxID=2777537 RepID=UPI001DE7FD59|nr:hypothetical protein [Paraburkholderia saeva]CAG4924336.1 hypothetical protein R70241_05254 [Paraburkholderia saeva]
MKTSLRLFIAQAALVAAGACVVASASAAEVVIYAPTAPPAVRHEPAPAPRAGYVWDHGHWRYERGHYVWIAGHWQAERVGYHWMPGHWVEHGPNWRWIEGHWA